MCFGGGGGDGQAQADAERLREEEDARERRVQQGIDRINAVFLGGEVPTGQLAPGTRFDPNQQLFDSRGDKFGGFTQRFETFFPGGPVVEGGTPGAPSANIPPFVFQDEGDFGASYGDQLNQYNRRYGLANNAFSPEQGRGGQPQVTRGQVRLAPGGSFQEQFDEQAKLGNLFTGTETSGGFDDAFFDRRRQAELDFNLPQLADQFADQREQLTFRLANSGNLRSSVANEQTVDLAAERDIQDALIRSRAETGVNALRSDIENSRSNLIRQVQASGDADSAASLASAQGRNFSANVPSFNQLGALFKPIAVGASNFLQGRGASNANSARSAPIGTGSSGRTVG